MVSSGTREQLCRPPAVLLWTWLFSVLDYWGLVSLPRPLSLGQGQWSISGLMDACCDGLLIIFQFCSVVWLWMLLTGSGDELCGPLPALFQAVAYHPPTISPSAFLAIVYWKFSWKSSPCPSPLLRCTFGNFVPLLCASFQFLVYCSVFFFFRGVSLPRGLCGLS
jgi:hypothetical protein